MSYTFALYGEKLSREFKLELLDIEGALVCDRCQHASSDPDEPFFLVKRIVDGIPDTQIYCKQCYKKSVFVTSREEYEKKMEEYEKEVKKKGGCCLDIFDLT